MKDLEKYFRIIATITFTIALSVLSWDTYMRTGLMTGPDTSFTRKATNGYNSNEESKTMLTRSGAKCLTFDKTFDNLIASSNNIFITMPAKAAGTTMNVFAKQCVGPFGHGNMLNNRQEAIEDTFMKKGAEPAPSIISSHLFQDTAFINLVKNIPHQSLVLYIHRDETDRFMSAIKHVVVSQGCILHHEFKDAEIDGSRCVVNESEVIGAIKRRIQEMNYGASKIMTCDFYDAIETNFPQLVFVHYKQADRIQKVLAKYHCPDLLDNPVHSNVGAEKEMEAFLKLDKTGEEMALNDWVEVNRDMLEFMFQLDAKQTCKAKTFSMQDDLLGCEDKMLQITRDTSF